MRRLISGQLHDNWASNRLADSGVGGLMGWLTGQVQCYDSHGLFSFLLTLTPPLTHQP